MADKSDTTIDLLDLSYTQQTTAGLIIVNQPRNETIVPPFIICSHTVVHVGATSEV